MVNVATSINLPIKLVWPTHTIVPGHICNIIGLGDIIIPALLLSFCNRIDRQIQTSYYYYYCVLSYIVALSLCMFMYHVMQIGQPALLYIVPFTTYSVYYKAKQNDQLSLLM